MNIFLTIIGAISSFIIIFTICLFIIFAIFSKIQDIIEKRANEIFDANRQRVRLDLYEKSNWFSEDKPVYNLLQNIAKNRDSIMEIRDTWKSDKMEKEILDERKNR